MSATALAGITVLAEQSSTYPRDLSVADIEHLLPHRGEILFARHIRLLCPEHYQGFVTWELSSMGIAGHFPSLPIIPAVYLIEAAAQIAGAGMLACMSDVDSAASNHVGVLAGVRRCTFSKPTLPGNQVVFDITIRQGSGGFVFAQGSVSVESEQVASLDLVLAFAQRSQIFPPA
ncbi:3-hydroxyacyl-ACP dehydratase [Herbaspirillum sp. HC18]|nr:3-hydroxyacyl-ACP dehydratase [Herbaspirillum sp. HC18]